MEQTPISQEILVYLFTFAVGATAYWSKFSFSTNALFSVTWNWASLWQSTGKKVLLKTVQVSLPLLLVAMLASPAAQPALGLAPDAAARSAQALPIQPALARLAAQQPEQEVAVIVQKTGTDTDLEAEVNRLGGTVTQDLHIINAFGAQMSAGNALALAQVPGVRWVSLDRQPSPPVHRQLIFLHLTQIRSPMQRMPWR